MGGPIDLIGLLGASTDDFMPSVDVSVDLSEKCVSPVLAETSEDDSFYRYESDAPDKRSVLVLRDSFGIALLGLLPYEFSEVTFVTSPEAAAEYYEKEHPDIVILEIAERYEDRQENWPMLMTGR